MRRAVRSLILYQRWQKEHDSMTDTQQQQMIRDAMKAIAEEAATKPEIVKTAPHSTRVRRLDEVGAARKPILRWKPATPRSEAAD